jgi:hypothetical protein
MERQTKASALIITFFFTASSSGALAKDWKEIGAADLPAKVYSIRFGDGSAIDASHSLTWGAWTVLFNGNDRPIAEDPGRMQGEQLAIRGLRCHNEAVGDRPCDLFILRKQAVCDFTINNGPNARVGRFGVECPAEVGLR